MLGPRNRSILRSLPGRKFGPQFVTISWSRHPISVHCHNDNNNNNDSGKMTAIIMIVLRSLIVLIRMIFV